MYDNSGTTLKNYLKTIFYSNIANFVNARNMGISKPVNYKMEANVNERIKRFAQLVILLRFCVFGT